ncbi:hypothetical protein GR11A_00184 [Vibrio phage vB_VcorM_GR11A]|nr:hypothetical protein GR11A_00184 [Vibrio phage vB_VcorM_GR11A]
MIDKNDFEVQGTQTARLPKQELELTFAQDHPVFNRTYLKRHIGQSFPYAGSFNFIYPRVWRDEVIRDWRQVSVGNKPFEGSHMDTKRMMDDTRLDIKLKQFLSTLKKEYRELRAGNMWYAARIRLDCHWTKAGTDNVVIDVTEYPIVGPTIITLDTSGSGHFSSSLNVATKDMGASAGAVAGGHIRATQRPEISEYLYVSPDADDREYYHGNLPIVLNCGSTSCKKAVREAQLILDVYRDEIFKYLVQYERESEELWSDIDPSAWAKPANDEDEPASDENYALEP